LTVFAALWAVPMLDTGSPDPVTVIVNYGGLVAAFILVIIGRLHTSGEITVLQQQITALTKQVDDRDDTIKAKDALLAALAQSLSHQMIPAMAQSSAVLEAIPSQETALATLLREALGKVDTLTATLSERGPSKESP
jgi:hypothetical protein